MDMRLCLRLTVATCLLVGVTYAAVAWGCYVHLAGMPGGGAVAHGQHLVLMLGAVPVVILPGLFLLGALVRRVIRPVLRLQAAAGRIGGGDLEQPVPPGPADEIGDLAACMESMRSGLLQDRERLRAAEQEKRRFYRDTIAAVSGGRLVLCDAAELDALLGPPLAEVPVASAEDQVEARARVRSVAAAAGMAEERLDALELALGEALGNALKHAGGGRVSVHAAPECLRVMVADRGPGIDTLSIPRATLQRGWSTRISLGLGFSMMLELADRVYLDTGRSGTRVLVEMGLAARPADAAAALASWSRF